MARKQGTLLDVMPGRHDVFHEEPDGSFTIETRPDLTIRKNIIDYNKSQYNDYGGKLSVGKMGEFHHVAKIQIDIWESWLRETNGDVAEDPKVLAAKLNDPDFKLVKTSPTNL